MAKPKDAGDERVENDEDAAAQAPSPRRKRLPARASALGFRGIADQYVILHRAVFEDQCHRCTPGLGDMNEDIATPG